MLCRHVRRLPPKLTLSDALSPRNRTSQGAHDGSLPCQLLAAIRYGKAFWVRYLTVTAVQCRRRKCFPAVATLYSAPKARS
jgi:hypothetical protein